MAIRYIGGSSSQREQMDRSQERIRRCIRASPVVIPRELLTQLNEMLDESNKDTDIELHVTRNSAGYWGYGGSYIEINPRCFKPWKENPSTPQNPPRLTAVLLHEMVHVAGGEELDAEFFENRLFTRKEGATLPTPEDEADFKDSQYRGYFVRLDPHTREVRDLHAGRPLGKLQQAATPQNGGPNPMLATKGGTMAGEKQEELAKMKIETMNKRKNQMGVRVVVEFTGYLDKGKLVTFMNGIRNTLKPHLEGNGGGG